MLSFEQFKPVIFGLIQYYYDELENGAGGCCHIALDDGNLSEKNFAFCQDYCQKHNDQFGYFIATILRHFTEEERDEMYENHWWGVQTPGIKKPPPPPKPPLGRHLREDGHWAVICPKCKSSMEKTK
ncbi:MAG TPA: hypothetical protein ENI07_16500 [Desulfobacterales bacterium]|nr:hypothetical protein [Desulfobacterales bacterium]